MAVRFQGGKAVPSQISMNEAKSVGRAYNFVRVADRAINEAAQVIQEGAKLVPASVLNEYQQAARAYVDVMQESAKAKKTLELIMSKLDASRRGMVRDYTKS